MGQSQSARTLSPDEVRTLNPSQVSPRGQQFGNAPRLAFDEDADKVILGKYKMDMSQEGFMGEGSFSTCRKGKNKATGEAVAIKFFKVQRVDATQLFKFRRQITVLNELQAPFVQPSDPRLWHPELEKAKPARLFMRLIDYSKDKRGEPGIDVNDGVLEVVTELAQYSMLDFLSTRKKDNQPLSKETVKSITKALLLVMGGLHAKGMVHLDMKPENLMVFDGCLKLIDVDGCVQIGSTIRTDDPSISFSPCYCSPEWAKFLVDPGNSSGITAAPGLDVWSVGCTICELVTLDAIMKPIYANLLRRAHSHREASFLFLDWLRALKSSPLPRQLPPFDAKLAELIQKSILVPNYRERMTCVECLDDPYFRSDKFHRSKTNPLTHTADEELSAHMLDMPTVSVRVERHRREDHSSVALHQGTLWKLNSGKDPNDPAEWLQRDMWIANNGSLCYYSQVENKRLVLLDSHHLYGSQISYLQKSARPNALQIKTTHIEAPGDQPQVYTFAAPSPDEAAKWLQFLTAASRMEVMPTMNLGPDVAQALEHYKMTVKNRRMKVDAGNQAQFGPIFKATLWKVKADGDRMRDPDWFKREMWIARNGSLVYYSPKDERELVYYTTADIARASFEKIPNYQSAKPWTFQVRLPPNEGIEFAPGEFAAESEMQRDHWIMELTNAKRGQQGDNDDDCFGFLGCCTSDY